MAVDETGAAAPGVARLFSAGEPAGRRTPRDSKEFIGVLGELQFRD